MWCRVNSSSVLLVCRPDYQPVGCAAILRRVLFFHLHLCGVQVQAADVVVVNKCDLAGLGAISSVEDEVQHVSLGVRMIRARFGQVRQARENSEHLICTWTRRKHWTPSHHVGSIVSGAGNLRICVCRS